METQEYKESYARAGPAVLEHAEKEPAPVGNQLAALKRNVELLTSAQAQLLPHTAGSQRELLAGLQ